jgi:uncharacterized damage-inducible protein DinB
MTQADLQTLLDYHYWARDRLLDAIATLSPEQFTRDQGSSFKSVRDTVAHTYAAEWAWYERWQGRSPKALLPSDQFPDVDSIRSAWREHETKMRDYVASLDERSIARVVDYTLLSGASGSTPLWQMLQHVVNHASYHRGQVTTMLRQMAAEPPKSMDLIAYYRR